MGLPNYLGRFRLGRTLQNETKPDTHTHAHTHTGAHAHTHTHTHTRNALLVSQWQTISPGTPVMTRSTFRNRAPPQFVCPISENVLAEYYVTGGICSHMSQ
jgi:hypothetical protein